MLLKSGCAAQPAFQSQAMAIRLEGLAGIASLSLLLHPRAIRHGHALRAIATLFKSGCAAQLAVQSQTRPSLD